MANYRVRINDTRMKLFIASIASTPGAGGIGLAMAKVYSAFLRRRFSKNSRGREWPKIQPATAKRKKSKLTLVDQGALARAVNIGAAGNYAQPIKGGMRYGFSESQHHSGLSYRKLAEIHHDGVSAKNIPARPIVVNPDKPTELKMYRAVKHNVQRKIAKFGKRVTG